MRATRNATPARRPSTSLARRGARCADQRRRVETAAILYKLKRGEKRAGEAVSTIPTLDFNVETVKHKGKVFGLWVRRGGGRPPPPARAQDARLCQPASLSAGRLPRLRMSVGRTACDPCGGTTSRARRASSTLSTRTTASGQERRAARADDTLSPTRTATRLPTPRRSTPRPALPAHPPTSPPPPHAPQAAEELHKMITDHEMRFAVLLVYANKSDLPHALSTDEVATELRLDKLGGRKYHVQPTVGTTGQGLWDGLTWLAANAKPI